MNEKATIYYYDIGDYLTREQKLARIREFGSIANMHDQLVVLKPNKHGDWISHRDEGFEELIPLAPDNKFNAETQSVFTVFGGGLKTNRDAWVYQFSKTQLHQTISQMIDYYNTQRLRLAEARVQSSAASLVDIGAYNATRITWTRGLRQDADRNKVYTFDLDLTRTVAYRPFCKQHAYSIKDFVEVVGFAQHCFPTSKHENQVICLPGTGGAKDFTAIITDVAPDYEFIGDSQCFPLYYYEKRDQTDQMSLFDTGEEYTRRDGISDFILERVKDLCGSKVTKIDIFYYVYGILHSEAYRMKYAVNLKKTLPRLPLPEDSKLFWAFSKAGAKLADLHLHYETLPSEKDLKEDSPKANPSYHVTKMRFAKEGKEENKTAIIYNDDVTVWNIPLEAYEYIVNGKPAIEWIMERYAVTTHKESTLVNDPNHWCAEHNQPRYIIDLLKRIVTLSIETMKVVKNLPSMGL